MSQVRPGPMFAGSRNVPVLAPIMNVYSVEGRCVHRLLLCDLTLDAGEGLTSYRADGGV